MRKCLARYTPICIATRPCRYTGTMASRVMDSKYGENFVMTSSPAFTLFRITALAPKYSVSIIIPKSDKDTIERINKDYKRHQKAARAIAEEYFDARKQMKRVCDAIGL